MIDNTREPSMINTKLVSGIIGYLTCIKFKMEANTPIFFLYKKINKLKINQTSEMKLKDLVFKINPLKHQIGPVKPKRKK